MNDSAKKVSPARLPVSVRAASNGYTAAVFVAVFIAAFLVYMERDLAAAGFAVISVAAVIVLALTDRITFDGKRIRRTGLIFRLAARGLGARDRLRLTDVEQVDTLYFRTLARGSRIGYKFRTTFHGKGAAFTITSVSRRYTLFVRSVLSRLEPDVLDARSVEIRDHLVEPVEARLNANLLHIPASEVIEPALLPEVKRREPARTPSVANTADPRTLREVGNQLRLAGSLVRALEAFRRALVVAPDDAWLLFDSARCLHSYSGVRRDGRLERRALALMRLAEKRAGNNGELLSLIGESYAYMGEWRRASTLFKRIADNIGATFRSLRGQAEIALREGKIAHVIHNFAAAHRESASSALRRWTKGEMEYFSRLHGDEEYMELEVSRVNLIDSLARWQKTMLRIYLIGVFAVIFGVALDETVAANAGWAIGFVAIIIWCGMHVARWMLGPRIPFAMVDHDHSE